MYVFFWPQVDGIFPSEENHAAAITIIAHDIEVALLIYEKAVSTWNGQIAEGISPEPAIHTDRQLNFNDCWRLKLDENTLVESGSWIKPRAWIIQRKPMAA